MTKIKT